MDAEPAYESTAEKDALGAGRGQKVLFLTKVYPYPPANAGDAVYSRGIIEALSAKCRLSVLCANSGSERVEALPIDYHIVGWQRRGRVGSVVSRWPLIAWKGATPQFVRALDGLLRQEWDAIVLDNLGLAHTMPRVLSYRGSRPRTRLVYVSHEYEYPTRGAKYGTYQLGFIKRLVSHIDLQKVKAAEERLLREMDIVTVINQADLKPFRTIASEAKYLPMPPGYDGPIARSRVIDKNTPRRVLLLGGRRSEQKKQILLDWLEASYERLTASAIEMVVVGDMEDNLREALSVRYPNVEVMGFVDDMQTVINSARMGLIADTVGGGFKLRLLTHVFQRLPIVGLSSAISGLPTANGDGYLGTPNLAGLVETVCATVDDTERLNALHNLAFDDCAPAFSWQARAQAFADAIGGAGSDLLV